MQQCRVVWSNMRIQSRLPSWSPSVPRPALLIVYAVGALDSGVEFLREMGRPTGTEQVERLVAEYEAGGSMRQLAKRWHLRWRTVAEPLR
jgi:hypothetical protein